MTLLASVQSSQRALAEHYIGEPWADDLIQADSSSLGTPEQTSAQLAEITASRPQTSRGVVLGPRNATRAPRNESSRISGGKKGAYNALSNAIVGMKRTLHRLVERADEYLKRPSGTAIKRARRDGADGDNSYNSSSSSSSAVDAAAATAKAAADATVAQRQLIIRRSRMFQMLRGSHTTISPSFLAICTDIFFNSAVGA